MALNRFMHPRNIYKDAPPNFKELSEQYPVLKCHLVERHEAHETSGNGEFPAAVSLDFENPAALRALTCALLHRDFNLNIEIPLTKLIPTVPSRLNYLLWIEDLLHAHKLDGVPQEVLGLDIGSGASCIYALLGFRKNGWSFVTTESDEEALRFAQENVVKNGAGEKISVLQADGTSHLLGVVNATGKEFHFCMCNPPFFGSLAERDEKASYKPPKHAANPVAETDAVVDGGEVAFVTQMIEESQQLKEKIKIYSSMLGKKSSVAPLKAILQAHKISYTSTEFCQGRTMRWGLAWSFGLDLKSVAVLNPHKAQERSLSYEIDFGSKSETERMEICLKVLDLLGKDLEMYVVSERGGKERSKWRVSAVKNLWSHQRRKRREQNQKVSDDVDMEDGNPMASPRAVSRSSSRTPDSSGEAKTKPRNLLQFFLLTKSDSLKYSIELRWIDGDNREHLHGILVYLKNQLQEFLK